MRLFFLRYLSAAEGTIPLTQILALEFRFRLLISMSDEIRDNKIIAVTALQFNRNGQIGRKGLHVEKAKGQTGEKW